MLKTDEEINLSKTYTPPIFGAVLMLEDYNKLGLSCKLSLTYGTTSFKYLSKPVS